MPLKAADWNVIIVGRWNRAILTPAGIAKRVFKLDDPKQVMVAVPLDGVSPYQVQHPTQNIIAMTDETRLRIHLVEPGYEALDYAKLSGICALESLPETPVAAAGFNIDFHAPELSPEQASLVSSSVDTRLAGLGCAIAGRTLARSLEYEGGRLNVNITGALEEFKLCCNFHRSSENMDELKAWLATPLDGVQSIVEGILAALDLQIEETEDEIDEG